MTLATSSSQVSSHQSTFIPSNTHITPSVSALNNNNTLTTTITNSNSVNMNSNINVNNSNTHEDFINGHEIHLAQSLLSQYLTLFDWKQAEYNHVHSDNNSNNVESQQLKPHLFLILSKSTGELLSYYQHRQQQQHQQNEEHNHNSNIHELSRQMYGLILDAERVLDKSSMERDDLLRVSGN